MHAIYKDTETGGLYPAIHALLSIGACCTWDAPPFLAYITAESQPGKTIDPDAAKKNGYTREKWAARGARPLAEVMPEYLAWIEARKKERPGAVFVCHHLAFDKPFIAEAARSVGSGDLPHRNDWRCSQVLFGQLMDRGMIERGSSSLDRLRELSGYDHPRNEEHDALEDAEITRHGHQWLLNKDRESELTLQHLYSRALQELRTIEDALQQISVWYENGRAQNRGSAHMLEEITCLAKAAIDGNTPGSPSEGARRITAERLRQIHGEGWSAENDDQYRSNELLRAALSYLLHETQGVEKWNTMPDTWPWDKKWWKPSPSTMRNLEKVGALVAADMDRRTRMEGAANG